MTRFSLERRQGLNQRLMVFCIVIRRQIIMRVKWHFGVIGMASHGVWTVAMLLEREDMNAVVNTLKATHRLECLHPRHRQQGDESNKDAGRRLHDFGK